MTNELHAHKTIEQRATLAVAVPFFSIVCSALLVRAIASLVFSEQKELAMQALHTTGENRLLDCFAGGVAAGLVGFGMVAASKILNKPIWRKRTVLAASLAGAFGVVAFNGYQYNRLPDAINDLKKYQAEQQAQIPEIIRDERGVRIVCQPGRVLDQKMERCLKVSFF